MSETLSRGDAEVSEVAVAEAATLDVPGGTLPAPGGMPAWLDASDARGSTVLPRLELAEATSSVSIRRDPRQRYREVEVLGTGGVGEVRLAADEDIGRAVALKRLHDASDPALVMRFVDEVRVLGQLDHPNIVPVHDVGVDESGRLFFVMKKVEGETLESLIERLRSGDRKAHRMFPVPVRTAIMTNILRAVQFAHEKRIIHRDLKPANIMIGRFGEVVVMDWGIAKRLSDPLSDALDASAPPRDEARGGDERPFRTRVGSLLGTPFYMSPEQARGENDRVDERSDIYALGVMFHELLALEHYLGDATTIREVLHGVQTRVPVSAAAVRPAHQAGVPVELAQFIEKATAKEPEARFQSSTEMLEALHRVLNGTFPVTCPVTFVRRVLFDVLRLIDAYPQQTALLVMLSLAGAVVGLGYGIYRAVLG